MKKELLNQLGLRYYKVEYKPEEKTLFATWYGEYLSEEELKEACMLSLDLIQTYHIPLLINDNRLLTGTWDSAQSWISSYWIPEAKAGGLRRFAHVLAEEFYAKLSAELMNEDNPSFSHHFKFRIFEDYGKALAWLYRYKAKEVVR